MSMEARCDVMTDRQFDGMLEMVLEIIERCPSQEEAIKAVRKLIRNKDRDNTDRDDKKTR